MVAFDCSPPGRVARDGALVAAFAGLAWACDAILASAWKGSWPGPHDLLASLGVVLGGAWVAVLSASVAPARRFALAVTVLLSAGIFCAWGLRHGPPSRRGLLLAGPLVVAALFVLASRLRAGPLLVATPFLVFAYQQLKLLEPEMSLAAQAGRALPALGAAAALALAVLLLARSTLSTPARLERLARPVAAATLLAAATGLAALGAWHDRAFAATSRDPAPRAAVPPADGLPNVVLVVADTLRTDRVGVYGYATRPTTPFLDRFAATADVYRNAYATSSWTLPSMASMFTGLAPEEHGVHVLGHLLPRHTPTLAEELRALGYHTTGISANPILQAEHGFGRGFERFVQLTRLSNPFAPPTLFWADPLSLGAAWRPERFRWWSPKPRAARVTDEALRALGERPPGRPAFVFVLYFDPHSPYNAPDSPGTRDWRFDPGETRFDPWSSFMYDREVRTLDGELSRFLEGVDEELGRERTLVVVTSDHGEELGEEGRYGHGTNLGEALVRVPLVVRRPGQTAGRDVPGLVSLVRLPALVATGALSRPDEAVRAHVRTGPGFGRRLRSVQRDGWKLLSEDNVGDPAPPVDRLYRLPDERRDLRAEEPGIAAALRSRLDELPDVAKPARLGEEERAKLRALGYLR